MLRVLETISHSDVAWAFTEEQRNLTSWVTEIVSATWPHQVRFHVLLNLRVIYLHCPQQTNGTLLNTLDNPNSFADSSSTALLAASTYRLATITKDDQWIPFADKASQLIVNSVDQDGWLENTVDPETFNTPSLPGAHSPEGQTFTILLYVAQQAYLQSTGQN